MANLQRYTQKIFGSASNELGQFGSAIAGTKVTSSDVETLQSLQAYLDGWSKAVVTNKNYPTWQEMDGVLYGITYQLAYMLQQGVPEWDSATDYYINGFCSKNGKIYLSLTDNNINNDPETDTVNWQEFSSGGSGGSRKIGEIVTSTIPLSDAGLHLLDGSLLSYGSYAEFIDYIATLYNSGNYSSIFVSEATWQSRNSSYGVCGKFVYDSVNNTVRLPKITGFIEGTSSSSSLGDVTEAGLPDITSNISYYAEGNPIGNYGAFHFTKSENGSTGTTGSLNDHAEFKASWSNSIYGKSLTVQPQSTKVFYYIVIGTTVETQLVVDINQIATDLNGKADKDLTNVPTSKAILTQSYVNGTSWYRIYSDKWCEQGGMANKSSGDLTVNLLKTFTNSNYALNISQYYTSTSSSNPYINAKNISSFVIRQSNSSAVYTMWRACGYIN